MPSKPKTLGHFLHELFELGVVLKAVNGTWETGSGVLLLFFHTTLIRIMQFLIRGELLENPQDRIVSYLTHIPAQARKFAGTYILVHGVLNIFLAYQLFRERLWAYLVTIGATAIFIAYQLYRVHLYHSMILLAVTVMDIVFVMLTYREYRYHAAGRDSNK